VPKEGLKRVFIHSQLPYITPPYSSSDSLSLSFCVQRDTLVKEDEEEEEEEEEEEVNCRICRRITQE
jgi:hypothetical protein